jgi:hypothetical protein
MNTNKETIEIAQKFLLGDLIKVAINEIKRMPFAWGVLPEKDQQKVIDTITDKFTSAVRQAVMHIAADGRPHLVADVDSVTFKDGIKCQLTVAKQSADRHELADATGTMVLIVLPNIQKHLEGDIPKASPDQPELL